MGKWFQNKSFSTEKQEQGIKVRKGHRGINARKMHRALGILLAAALVFQTVPFEGIAVSASESSGGGLCEHHRSHTPACGYKEAEPGHGCSHEHTEDCYRTVEGEDGSTTKELDCHHEHDESCGYREAAEGSPCTFVCEICSGGTDKIPEDKTDGNEINDGGSENQGTENGNETEEPGDGQEECICEERCTEDSINTDCPVCGAGDASLSDCKGKDTEDSTEDAEENTDQPEDTGLCKHHREHDDACGYLPESEDSEGSPCTYECRICPVEELIAALPDKVTEDNAEDVRAQLDKILALFGELTEDEQEQLDLSRCYELQGALDAANDPMPLATGNVVLTDLGQKISFTVDECGNNCQGHTITQNVQGGVVEAAKILVESGTHNITFSGLNLSSAAVGIMPGGTMNLTLESSNKIATGNNKAGIYVPIGATLVITKESTGSLTVSGNDGAGIGGAYFDPTGETGNFDCGTVVINGGTIAATGSGVCAGIGGAYDDGNQTGGNGGTVTINGGTVTATGGVSNVFGGAGIGGCGATTSSKDSGCGGTLTINGGHVTLAAPCSNAYGFGKGYGRNPSGTCSLTLADESYLTLTDGTNLDPNGTYTINGDPTEDMIVVPELVYTGEILDTSEIRIDDSKTGTATYFGQTFQVKASADGWVLQDLGEVREAKEYTATFKKDDKEISKKFTVAQSGTEFTGDGAVKTYKDGAECSDFTASDTITVKATPTPTGKAPAPANSAMFAASFTEPATGQMAVYVGTTQVSAPVSADTDGSYTMTVPASEVLLAAGGPKTGITLTAKFVGNTSMADGAGTVNVNISAVAKIEKNNAIIGYVGESGLDAAFNNSDYAGATFTLLVNVTRTTTLVIKVNCILDLGGHNITFIGSENVWVQGSVTAMTIRGEGEIISEQSHALVCTGTVTLEGGTFTSNKGNCAGVYVNYGTLSVTGEKVVIRNTSGGYGLTVKTELSVQLSGGKYSGTAGAISIAGGSLTLGGLLPQGGDTQYAYFKDTSTTPLTGVLSDQSLTGTVTVQECEHVYEYTHTSGATTHRQTCLACGNKWDEENCSFGENGKCACEAVLAVTLPDNLNLTYTGTAQTPAVTVTVDGQKLAAANNYTVTYANNMNAGENTAKITVSGTSFTGKVVKTFTINKATLTTDGKGTAAGTYGAKLSELTVTGPSVKLNGTEVSGTWKLAGDTIPNAGNTETRNATFTPASGGENYNPLKAQVTLNIAKATLTVTSVTIKTRPYKPTYHTAEVSGVTFTGLVNGETLTLGEDYIAYGNYDDPNAGANKRATIVVELKSSAKANNYTLPKDSSVNATGTITAIPIADKNVTLSPASAVYDGTEQKPIVTIAGLTEGTDYTVSYTGDFTKAGEHTVTVTGKGNYEGTVTKTFTIEKAEQTDFAFAAVTKPYEKNGTFTLSTTGGGGNGAVLYRVPENNGVLMVNGDQATIIGVGTVTVTATKAESVNYKAATATGTIRITKAPAPAITYPAVGSITYGQKLSDCALTGGSTEYGTFAWENGSTIPAVDNTGYTVVFTASEETKKNYETITNTTKSVSVKVEKAAPAVSVTAAVSGSKDNRQAVLTVNVAKAGAGAFPTGTVTFIDCTGGTEAEIGTVTLSNGSASYTWDGLRDKTYTIKAVYTGNDNYKEAGSRELTFNAAKQNQQDFALDAIGAKTYGDAAITLKTTGGSGNGAVRYESSDENVIRIEGGRAVIAGAGTATITAIKEGDDNYNEASASRNVTVAKKALTVKADSKTVVRGNPMPAFTYWAEGLVNGDTFTAAPSITAGAQDTDTLGKYDIVISGGTLQNSESYHITYVNGTLNIVERFYTVTVTDGTGGGEYAEGDTVMVTANERNGYTFTGWSSEDGVAFADSKAKTTTFTMPAKSVTVKANYTRNSSGGNNGGGSGDGGNSGGSGNNGGGNSGDDGNNGGGGSTTPQISVKLPVQNTNPGNEATPGPEITSVNPGTGDTSRPGIAPVNPGIGDTSRPGTTPVNPGIGNTARPGTTPGSGSAGTPAQGTKQPFIKGADGKIGWDVIRAEEENAEEGSVINVDMNGSTVVPGDLFDSIKGKDITITFDMGNGILWSVDGKSITTDKAGDIDFSVKSGVKTVPVDIINNVTGKSYSIQISLAYEGEFGFTAVLSINLGKENAGYAASLYYYNESTGELEFICSDEVAQDGTVSLAFTHASDYVIAIDGDGEEGDGAAEPVQPDNTVQAAGNGTAQDSDGIPESPGTVQTGRAWWMIAILLFIAVIGAGIAIAVVREKRKGGRNNSWRNSM